MSCITEDSHVYALDSKPKSFNDLSNLKLINDLANSLNSKHDLETQLLVEKHKNDELTSILLRLNSKINYLEQQIEENGETINKLTKQFDECESFAELSKENSARQEESVKCLRNQLKSTELKLSSIISQLKEEQCVVEHYKSKSRVYKRKFKEFLGVLTLYLGRNLGFENHERNKKSAECLKRKASISKNEKQSCTECLSPTNSECSDVDDYILNELFFKANF